MKLHLPIKLRASLIAAIIAVPALVYNARAVDYVAPSDWAGWDTNDISLTERYLHTSGNTYTAISSSYIDYQLDADGTHRAAFLAADGTIVPLTYDGAGYGYYEDPDNLSGWVSAEPTGYYASNGVMVDLEGHKYDETQEGEIPTIEDAARIIIDAKASTAVEGRLLSVMDGNTSLKTNGTLEINNSVQAGENYAGKVNLVANAIAVSKDESNQSSIVVLEDVNISDYADDGDDTRLQTSIDGSSRLVIINGSTEGLSAEQKEQLNLTGIDSTAGISYGPENAKQVDLGAVSGQGSLSILGDQTADAEGHMQVTIDRIASGEPGKDFGEVGMGNVDVTIKEGIDFATTVSLVNSDTRVTEGGVTTRGLNVDAASGLTAKGDISNLPKQGGGHVDIRGSVVSEEGSVLLTNGKAATRAGVHEGAVVSAKNNVTLSNIDAVQPAEIKAETGNLTLTADSSLQGAEAVTVGKNLVVEGSSAVSDSKIAVGGDVLVTDRVTGSTATPGASSLNRTEVVVTPAEGRTSTVQIANGSTMTDSSIMGANGDVVIGGNRGEEKVMVSTTTGVSNFMASTTEAPVLGEDGEPVLDEEGNPVISTIVNKKGNLAATLAALGSQEDVLTPEQKKQALGEAGLEVGSMIGNTTGNVSVKDAAVTGTVITGGGHVAVGTPDTQVNQELMEQIKAQLPNLDQIGEKEGQFTTFVDGSIIDVRGNLGLTPQPENNLTIGDAAVSNTVILGITGAIKVSHSVLDNDYIDGGKSLELNDVVIIDSPILNLQADIKLTNSMMVTSSADGQFVMNTLGTYDGVDQDILTGGSILLDATSLSNGIIKSGYQAIYDPSNEAADSNGYVWEKQVSDQLAQIQAEDGTLESLGVNLPSGQISVTGGSTLQNMKIATVSGMITVVDSTVSQSALTSGEEGDTASVGSITVAGSQANGAVVENSTLSTQSGAISIVNANVAGSQITSQALGLGGISVATSEVTNSTVSTQDGGMIVSDSKVSGSSLSTQAPLREDGTTLGRIDESRSIITKSSLTTTHGAVSLMGSPRTSQSLNPQLEGRDNANGRTSITTSLVKLGGSATDRYLTSFTVMSRANLTGKVYGVYLQVTDAQGRVVTSTNKVDFDSSLKPCVFNFAELGVELDPEKDYTFSFVNAEGQSVGVPLYLTDNNNVTAKVNGFDRSAIVMAEVMPAFVKTSFNNQILGSKVATGNGSLTIANTYMDSLAGEDGAYTKNTIQATANSSIAGSYVNGSDVTISQGDLIVGNSLVRGDVNITAGGRVILTDSADVAMDGDRQGEGTRDASIEANALYLISLNNKVASLSNGQIQVGETRFYGPGRNQLVLDHVNSADGEESGQLGHVLQWTQDTEGDESATLSIRNGSVVSAGKIDAIDTSTNPPSVMDPADASSYFGTVQVSGDSTVNVSDTATVRNLEVNAQQEDVDQQGSTVVFQKAWLTHATIKGVDERLTGAFGVPATENITSATVEADTHIGNLALSAEGTLNLVNKTGEEVTSYIANINEGAEGSINVANEILVTPVLNHENLSLGLNGATVELAAVSAEQGATVASAAVANPHVLVREITNGAIAGSPAVDKAAGISTIRTELTNALGSAYTENSGTPTTVTATTYYYLVATDGYTVPEGQTVTIVAPDGTERVVAADDKDRAVDTGSIVKKTDAALTYATKADGSSIATGVSTQDAVHLVAGEEAHLVRITVPVLNEDGSLRYEELPGGELVLVVGQTVSQETLQYAVDWSENLGSVETKSDGIASLTVKEDFDADNTNIRAYELGETHPDTGVVSAVVNTGFIDIQGNLTGQDNRLQADQTISVGGILADGDMATENHNTLVSDKGNISVGDAGIQGSKNLLATAQGNISVVGHVAGHDNTLSAVVGSVQVNGSLTGDRNLVKGASSVKIDGGVLGASAANGEGEALVDPSDNNTILSQGALTLGATEGQSLVGNNNRVESAGAGDVTLAGQVSGGNNRILAANGNISAGAVSGSQNTVSVSNKGDISLGNITGDDNAVITDDGQVTAGHMTGNRNDLTAFGGSVTMGRLAGNSNGVLADTTATLQSMAGDSNTVLASQDVTIAEGVLADAEDQKSSGNHIDSLVGSVIIGSTDGQSLVGDRNIINALADGANITLVGGIQGNQNKLTAGGSISTGSIVGESNRLEAGAGDVTIVGDLNGEGNILSSSNGSVVVNGSVIGSDVDGNGNVASNMLTAHNTVTIDGTVAGEGTKITAYAAGLSQDDVAISIGTFAAQGTDLNIATTSSPIYGSTNGNGSIVINTLGTLEGADLNLEKVNHIVSNNSYVMISSMDGSNARTNITAAKDVIIGSPEARGSLLQDTGSNLTIRGNNMRVNNASLTLTDSVVEVVNSITGTSLTLTTSEVGSASPVYASRANTVELNALTIGGNASLTANTVKVDNLTINGAYAVLDATSLTVQNTLTIQNGADMWINRVTAKNLVVTNSTFSVTSLKGIRSLTLQGSTGTVTAGLTGLTGNVTVLSDTATGNKSTLNTSVINTTGDVLADNSSILVSGDVFGNDITAQNGGTITGLNITASAQGEDAGDLVVSNGLIAATGNVSGDTLTLTGNGEISGKNIKIGGSISTTSGTIAAAGQLNGASLTASSSLITATTGIELGTGKLSASSGSDIRSDVQNAGDVQLASGSQISGKVNMSGALTVDESSIGGNVSGATGATLTHGSIGSLTLSGNDADVTATLGSVVNGAVTGADDVTVNGSQILGTVNMKGYLQVTAGSVGAVTGANQVTLNGAVTGAIVLSENPTGTSGGDVVASNGTSIIGAITNAHHVTLTDATVGGSIGMSGILNMENGSAGAVNGASRAEVKGATVNGNLTLGAGSADATDEEGKLVASVKVEDGSILGSIANAKSVDLADAVVTGSIDMNGSLTASHATTGAIQGAVTTASITNGSTIGSSIAASGKATVTDSTINGSLSGAESVTASNASIGGAVSSQNGSVTLTDVDVTKAGEDGVAVKGNTSVTIAEGSSIAGSVEAGTTATVTDSIVNGSLSGNESVTASNATIKGAVTSQNGAVTLTDADVTGNVQGASVAISEGSQIGSQDADTTVKATTGNITITGGDTVVNSNVIANAAEAVVTVDGATVKGSITTGETEDEEGNVHYAGTVNVTGGSTGAIATGSATLTNTTVGGVTTEENLTTNGDVVSTGNVTVGGALSVNQGVLNAGDNTVKVSGETTLNNGEVKAGEFTTDGLVLNQTSGEIGSLISNGSVDVHGGSLHVTSIDINAKDSDKGNLTLSDGASVQSSGAATVDGLTKVEANSTLSGTTLATTGLTVLADAVVTMAGSNDSEIAAIDLKNGALTVTGATVNGSLTNASDVVVTNGGHVNGAVKASGSLTVADSDVDDVEGVSNATLTHALAGDITLAKGQEITSGGAFGAGDVNVTDSTVGAIVNANDVTLTDAVTGQVNMDGVLIAVGSTTGQINGSLVSALVQGGSTIGSGIAASDKATVTDSTVDGSLSGDESVTALNASINGAVTSQNGSVTLTDVDVMKAGEDGVAVKGNTSVTIAEGSSIAGSVEAGTTATVTDSTINGSLSGAESVIASNASIGGAVSSQNGSVTLTDADVTGNVQGASVAISEGSQIGSQDADTTVKATTGNIDITGGDTVVNSNVIANAAEAVVTVDGATVKGSITTGETEDEEGNVHYAGTVNVTGGSTGAIATGSATLTNTTVGGVTTEENLTTNGDVVSTGNVTVGGALSVNQGVLNAGDNTVKVSGKTTLNNGEVKAGEFTTNGLELVNVGGSLQNLVSNGDFSISGQETLTVVGTVDINRVEADEEKGIEAQYGDLTLTQAGLTAGAEATVDGKTLVQEGAVLSGTTLDTHGLEVLTGGVVTMAGSEDADPVIDLNGGDLTVTTGSVTADTIAHAGQATVTNGTVDGSLTELQGEVKFSGTGVVTGSISFAKPLETEMMSLVEEDSSRDVTVEKGYIVKGNIAGADDVTVTSRGQVEGSITMDGELKVTDQGHVHAVTGAIKATLNKAQQDGVLEMAAIKGADDEGNEVIHYGTVEATDSMIGDVSNAGHVTLTGGSANSISMQEGVFKATDASVAGVVTGAEASDIHGAVAVGSLSTGGLVVNKGGSLDAQGDVTADGVLSMEGAVASREGDISLIGRSGDLGEKSSLAADVTAHAGKLTLDGTITAQAASLMGKEGVELKGTLEAQEGVAIAGTLSGRGTLNKSGGDELELAEDTNLEGGKVNVKGGSTLIAQGGKLGDLSVIEGAKLSVAADQVGRVAADSLTMSQDATLLADADLTVGRSDKVNVVGAADLQGALVDLTTGEVNESSVKDQTRLTLVEATSIKSGVSEDVRHSLDTLNVHAENTGKTVDLVFSKNYKGAEGKTFNQSQAAAGLSSLERLAPAGDLGGVMDALAHTRSEADALAALDSLGGAGLAGLQKVMADETKEHLQTLRSTIKSVAAGLHPRYQGGQLNECIQSNAFAGEVTGGHSEVSGNGNSGKYTRDSLGFMLAYAHALPNQDWKFGSALAYSYADAECASTTIKSDAVYFDLALTHDRQRFHQMGTLGFALFDFETERDVRVAAANHDYSGHADGSTKAVEFNVSYEMSYDLVVSEQHSLSSVVMAEATFAQLDTMKESGMGNAGLTSEWDDLASLTFGVGGRYTYAFGEERNPGYFMVEALFTADTGDTMPKVNNSFMGGGVTFAQEGPDAGDCGLRLNAGVLVPLGDQWGIFGNVTSEFRENGTFIGGGAGVKISF